ncbi:MAG: pyridoxal phosphate-dependent aminotransferase [Oscillospiraceae bacterium]|nr:pyridoxal phosphate-dependent aminotransferase [Oscillospiraceae bacterium]
MVSEKMLALGESRSVIRDISEFADARRQEIGAENVFDFSIGNPSVPAPGRVDETLRSLLDSVDSITLHSYTPAPGLMKARMAASRQESLRAGFDIPAGSIYLTCGAAASLAISLRALVCPGDKIALLAPYFPEYKVFVENAGAEAVVVPPADLSMQPDLAVFKKAVASGIKAVIVNSPNNPSGAVLSAETLEAMADILRAETDKKGESIYMIADEPYRELVYDGAEVPFVPSIYPDTIVCYSYSKSLSLPGERLGYIMVPPCVSDSGKVFAAVCGAGRSLGYLCAPSLFQYMLAECADERPDIAAYAGNRALLYGALTEMGFECVKPDGAFYLFVKAPNGVSGTEFYEAGKRFELLLVPSDSFGVEGYVRVAYCVSEDTIRRSLPAFKKLAELYSL